MLFGLAAMRESSAAAPRRVQGPGPAFTSPPVLTPNPSGRVPLAASVVFQTDVPTRVSILISAPGGYVFRENNAEPDYRTDHDVMVLGALPNTASLVHVIITDQGGQQTVSAPLPFQTPPLPADFPPIDAEIVDPAMAEPGFTLIGPRYSTPGGGPSGSFLVILDGLGALNWNVYRAHRIDRLYP